MGKMVEIRLHALTCEFAGDDLEVTGRLVVHAFNEPSQLQQTAVLFDFPSGPLRLRARESAAV